MTDITIPILVLFALALNVPFGAWRATTERLSLRWFLALHLPIPFILLLRLASDYTYRVLPLLVAASIAGQLLGSWAYTRWRTARSGVTRPPLAVQVPVDEQSPEAYR